MISFYQSDTYAGTVNNNIDYQIFRDFAENKGKFIPGVTNITILD
ncbi:hypothetical protein NOS08_004596 [Escherichia coli]|uniref:Peptidase S6 domain-containing protein n=1 Tax=Escherichia coli TaxID=562 RepID=A0A6D0XWN0_ECOLX|nr:hypothetical protein [Escherichia coli]EJM6673137.1 hypothetical protein [Escherichia coli]MBZ9224345.1 hypothetical protein [Escherichia coli]NDL81308.1 hypothetical protein [Escherichia coli]